MTATREVAPITAPHRTTNGAILTLGSLLFLAPYLVFASNFRGAVALEMIAATAIAGWLLIRRHRLHASSLLSAPVDPHALAVCLCLGVALVLLGGEGHLVYANSDWFWRDAVLADLARSADLPHYLISGVLYDLRAPLGLYMLPAMAGRAFGLGAGHAAMAMQNGLILGLILYGFSLLMPRRKSIRLIFFLAFSGLDLIGILLTHRHGLIPNLLDLPSHLSSWSLWQYSSQITQIFWVPNHALPGWWLALLILLCAQGEISLGYLGLAVAITLLWSPLPAIGALPFLLTLFMKDAMANLRDPWIWVHVLASLLFIPVASYLIINASQIPHSLGLHSASWILSYIIFEVIELALPICVLLNWQTNPPAFNSPAAVATLVLIVLPAFSFGSSDDLVMRSSIPALTILAFLFSGLPVAETGVRPAVRVTATVLAILAATTGGFEVARVMIFPRYAISNCDFMSVQQTFDHGPPPSHYLIPRQAAPAWLLNSPPARSAIKPEGPNCWPDYPFDPKLMVFNHSTRELLASAQSRRLRSKQ